MSRAIIAKAIEQIGGSLLPENSTHKNRFTIRSESSNRQYIVAQNKATGEWGCDCPGWIIKKPGKPRSCKHLKHILPAIGVTSRPTLGG